MKIVVGSKNPVKINAAKETFVALFPEVEVQCLGLNAPSGVPDQPMNQQDTRLGAINRVQFCQQLSAESGHNADFFVAMEGGVDCFEDGPCTFAYVVISNGKHVSVGRSASLPIPQSVYDQLHEGQELGPVMDKLFNTHNVKQKGGAIGLLTNGAQSRTSAYTQALTMAMGRFLHPQLFD